MINNVEDIKENLKNSLENVRENNPLTHCITNSVTINDCANAVLAIGGSPIMAEDEEEMEEVVEIADVLVINIGKLSKEQIKAMNVSAAHATKTNTPIVLDPVGAGISQLRNNTIKYLVENNNITAIRGNISEIKAIANMFKDDGLRLIEVKKSQLSFITDIIEDLSFSPLKFIIFIDDLTFSSNDDTFSYLKAILEGGVNSFPSNVVVYVTSNYRHLIKENFQDRTGDDIHIEDTIQQIMSLTNRFGIIITFQRPDKDLFIDIVHSYAEINNIEMKIN